MNDPDGRATEQLARIILDTCSNMLTGARVAILVILGICILSLFWHPN